MYSYVLFQTTIRRWSITFHNISKRFTRSDLLCEADYSLQSSNMFYTNEHKEKVLVQCLKPEHELEHKAAKPVEMPDGKPDDCHRSISGCVQFHVQLRDGNEY